MKTKSAQTLAKEYETGVTKESFYHYIVDNLVNGNRNQVKDLFSLMDNYDKKEFLIDYLNPTKGYDKSTLNICIGVLCS